eukprot:SAG11_NODE_6734_length_1257_cov_3.475820_2_plen_112_part_00
MDQFCVGPTDIRRIAVPLYLLISTAATAQQWPVVETHSGRVLGEVTRGLLRPHVTRFLGIPFAAPPTGDLRFRPPQVSEWTSPAETFILRHTHTASICMPICEALTAMATR